jgi:hypothetical protein
MAVPDIFDEVQEDLRAERARGLLKRFGGLFIVALLLVLAGVGGWQLWQQYKSRNAQREAGLYLAAQTLADGPQTGRAGALPQFATIATEAGPGYRTLARLRAAALKADAGDAAGAAALWNEVSADTQADPLLRDLASLQWALHQVDAGDPAAISARLQPLSLPANPWHALAQEAQALLALRQGQTDAARSLLKSLSADTTAPDGVRARAGGLLQRLGG